MSKKILYLAGLALSLLLTACSGGGSDSTVAAEFSVNGVKGTISGQNVTLDLSSLGNCAVNINNMVVTVNASGYTISPDPTAARDYSAPVDFTITAPDGTKVVYKVTVTGAACLGTAPAPATIACSAAPINPAESYSLVFKGCSASNVAEYYDKTECVRQNSTNLIWQGQTPAGSGLRANDQFKSNFDSTTEAQKWNGSTYVIPTTVQVDAITNSIGFKKAVNDSNLCGSAAWRIPSKAELEGIVNASVGAPTIDLSWFPNTPNGTYYWTNTTNGSAINAYAVDFSVGLSALGDRDASALVRLVH